MQVCRGILSGIRRSPVYLSSALYQFNHAASRPKSDLLMNIDHLLPSLSNQDLLELQSYSTTLLSDPICDLSLEDSAKHTIPFPMDDRERTPLQALVHKVYGQHLEYKKSAFRMGRICLERLENPSLCQALKIQDSFNHRAYFFTLHLWLLHTRLIHEGWQGETIDDELFDESMKLFADWLALKKVEEHRFGRELQNVQEFMYTFCIHLDLAMSDKDIAPARIRQVLWAHLYNSELDPDDVVLDVCTKYVIRQLLHVLQLDLPYFMSGHFIWCHFPYGGVRNARVIPAFQQPMTFMGFPNGRSVAERKTGLQTRLVGDMERKLLLEEERKKKEEVMLRERKGVSRPRLLTWDQQAEMVSKQLEGKKTK